MPAVAKGKGLLDAARGKAGAREVACPKMTKPADPLVFSCGTSSGRRGRSATPDACQALVDALGSHILRLKLLQLFRVAPACDS